jgi:hypothetical protein
VLTAIIATLIMAALTFGLAMAITLNRGFTRRGAIITSTVMAVGGGIGIGLLVA